MKRAQPGRSRRPPRPRGPGAALLLVALVLVALALVRYLPAGVGEPRLDVEVVEVPLDPEDATRRVVGPLRFRGGLWLRSTDRRFGGLSDLVVADEGRRFVAVSDCGRVLLARLSYDDGGDLVGLDKARLVDLGGPTGRGLGRHEVDAEALAARADGWLVGFEGRRSRLWRYGALSWASAQPLPLPDLQGCAGNRGLEALALLQDGRMLLICEGAASRPASSGAFVGKEASWTARPYPLDGGAASGEDVYRPTSARTLPGGDVLVLERRYPPLGARLRLLRRAGLDGDGALEPRAVVELEPPLTLDNLEGIEVRRAPTGELLVYLLSDDNGCAKGSAPPSRGVQRTLLLMFALDESALEDAPGS